MKMRRAIRSLRMCDTYFFAGKDYSAGIETIKHPYILQVPQQKTRDRAFQIHLGPQGPKKVVSRQVENFKKLPTI